MLLMIDLRFLIKKINLAFIIFGPQDVWSTDRRSHGASIGIRQIRIGKHLQRRRRCLRNDHPEVVIKVTNSKNFPPIFNVSLINMAVFIMAAMKREDGVMF